MVAGLVAAQLQELSLADCGRLATAFSMGAIAHLNYNLPSREILWQYFRQVDIRDY